MEETTSSHHFTASSAAVMEMVMVISRYIMTTEDFNCTISELACELTSQLPTDFFIFVFSSSLQELKTPGIKWKTFNSNNFLLECVSGQA